MVNHELVQIFHEIAGLLEIEGVDGFRPYAYRKVAVALESLEEEVESVYKREGLKGLKKISGIGKSTSSLIEEYIKTGEIKYYQELKRKIPIDFENLTKIEGIGFKIAKTLYQELGVKDVSSLKEAAEKDKIAPLFGFGKKRQKKILEGIRFFEKGRGRFTLGDILPKARELEKKITLIPEIEKVSMAGSLRRKKETIGDVDLLITAKKKEKIADSLRSILKADQIIGEGETKISIKTKEGFNVDFRIVDIGSYGSALQYFTGSKEHNIQLRRLAIKNGLKINEYGIFKGNKKIGGRLEEEIYNLLGLEWIPPEIREGLGEIEAAKKKIPNLLEISDMKGDLHCHSNWSGGKNTIEEMAQKAIKMGYEYIGIADHTKYLRIENGLDEKDLADQRREIDKINLKFQKRKVKFRILQGCEANILKDGSLDIEEGSLKKLDFVIAGVHSHFKMNKEEMTQRIIKTMENPEVDIISHPTGRILEKRDEYEIDFEKILEMAKKRKIILEINAYPKRLDLNDLKIKRAKDLGVEMIINSDAHHKDQMLFMEYGVFQARRGWAEKRDIVNTRDLNELCRILKICNKVKYC